MKLKLRASVALAASIALVTCAAFAQTSASATGGSISITSPRSGSSLSLKKTPSLSVAGTVAMAALLLALLAIVFGYGVVPIAPVTTVVALAACVAIFTCIGAWVGAVSSNRTDFTLAFPTITNASYTLEFTDSLTNHNWTATTPVISVSAARTTAATTSAGSTPGTRARGR